MPQSFCGHKGERKRLSQRPLRKIHIAHSQLAAFTLILRHIRRATSEKMRRSGHNGLSVTDDKKYGLRGQGWELKPSITVKQNSKGITRTPSIQPRDNTPDIPTSRSKDPFVAYPPASLPPHIITVEDFREVETDSRIPWYDINLQFKEDITALQKDRDSSIFKRKTFPSLSVKPAAQTNSRQQIQAFSNAAYTQRTLSQMLQDKKIQMDAQRRMLQQKNLEAQINEAYEHSRRSQITSRFDKDVQELMAYIERKKQREEEKKTLLSRPKNKIHYTISSDETQSHAERSRASCLLALGQDREGRIHRLTKIASQSRRGTEYGQELKYLFVDS